MFEHLITHLLHCLAHAMLQHLTLQVLFSGSQMGRRAQSYLPRALTRDGLAWASEQLLNAWMAASPPMC